MKYNSWFVVDDEQLKKHWYKNEEPSMYEYDLEYDYDELQSSEVLFFKYASPLVSYLQGKFGHTQNDEVCRLGSVEEVLAIVKADYLLILKEQKPDGISDEDFREVIYIIQDDKHTDIPYWFDNFIATLTKVVENGDGNKHLMFETS